MDKTITKAAKAQAAAPAVPQFDAERELSELRQAVQDMDCMSQEGFGEIAAIAKLAMISIARPNLQPHDIETIEVALEAIWSRAESVEDSLNATAEGVGCQYRSPKLQRLIATAAG